MHYSDVNYCWKTRRTGTYVPVEVVTGNRYAVRAAQTPRSASRGMCLAVDSLETLITPVPLPPLPLSPSTPSAHPSGNLYRLVSVFDVGAVRVD